MKHRYDEMAATLKEAGTLLEYWLPMMEGIVKGKMKEPQTGWWYRTYGRRYGITDAARIIAEVKALIEKKETQ